MHLGMIRRLQRIQPLQEHNRPEIEKEIKTLIKSSIEQIKIKKRATQRMAGSFIQLLKNRRCSRTSSPATASNRKSTNTHEKRASLRRTTASVSVSIKSS
jgi:hypothetical protein